MPLKNARQTVKYILEQIDDDDTGCENLGQSYLNSLDSFDSLELTCKRIHRIIYLLTSWSTQLFSLYPQYSLNARYSTIDTDVLFKLVEPRGINIGELVDINVKVKYFRDNKLFNDMITEMYGSLETQTPHCGGRAGTHKTARA